MAVKKKSDGGLRDLLNTLLQLVFGLIGGVLLCAVWLACKPVTITDTPPNAKRVATDRHEVIYVRGKAANRGPQGVRKQKAFMDRTPGELVLVEEDINRWLDTTYGPTDRTVTVDSLGLKLSPRAPVARLVNDELEIGVEIATERDGTTRNVVAQARGRFIPAGDRQVFVPRKIYLGSCPLPWNLGGHMLYSKMLSLYPIPANAVTAWGAVGQASIADSRLHLMIGGAAPAAMPATIPTQGVAPAVTTTVPADHPAAASSPEPAETVAPAAATAPAGQLPVSGTAEPPVMPATTTSSTPAENPPAASTETVPAEAAPDPAPAAAMPDPASTPAAAP